MNEDEAIFEIMMVFKPPAGTEEDQRKEVRSILSRFGSGKYHQGYEDGMWQE